MLYYRIRPAFDQCPRYDGSIFIGGELYTPAEMERFRVPLEIVDPVLIKKSRTYFFFGARLEVKDDE